MTMQSIITVRNNVLVRPINPPTDQKSDAGLYLVSTTQDQVISGTVVAIGQEVQETAVSDVVYFNTFTATKLDINGSTFYSLVEDQILAIVVNE